MSHPTRRLLGLTLGRKVMWHAVAKARLGQGIILEPVYPWDLLAAHPKAAMMNYQTAEADRGRGPAFSSFTVSQRGRRR